jgi:hypothetical protein
MTNLYDTAYKQTGTVNELVHFTKPLLKLPIKNYISTEQFKIDS